MGMTIRSKIMYTLVLAALVITVTLFGIEAYMHKKIDTVSVIPKSPDIKYLIAMPTKPKNIIPGKPHKKMFQPKIPTLQLAEKFDTSIPALSHEGIPIAWVLHVGSFREKSAARSLSKKLISNGHKSYIRDSSDSSGIMSRVFIGPKIIKEKLIAKKAVLDKEYGFNSHMMLFEP